MPILPVRDLGGAGIVSDIDPYNLPPNVFSAGVNVRFENGTVSRAPVMHRVHQFTEVGFEPAYMFSIPPIASGGEALIGVANDYSAIISVTGDTVADLTPLVINVNDTLEPFSHTFLGNVAYLNRKSNVPLQKAQGDATFVDLTAWNVTWRANIMRSYKDFLIALNLQKGGVEFPTMVKWSDVAQFGAPPASWDETDPATNAGENILNEMRGPIVDGLSLRDSFYIYGENEVWAMTFIGGNFIFDFRKRFDDAGMIAANCVVEVDGQHFVFDQQDIYVHDGATKQSIIHGRNKDFVYNGLVTDLDYLCFVAHDPRLNEIRFCYPSNDRFVVGRDPVNGCNRAAVFNYRRNTWSFEDLPNVTAQTLAQLTSGDTYEDAEELSYEVYGGSYIGLGDVNTRFNLFSSRPFAAGGITASRIYGLDTISNGRLPKPVEQEALRDAFVERIGIDLDESGAAITAYKSQLKFYPQLGISNEQSTVTFQFGANDVSGLSPVWDTPQIFQPTIDHQLSVRKAGRYLAYRLNHSGLNDFSFSGFDANVTVRGRR